MTLNWRLPGRSGRVWMLAALLVAATTPAALAQSIIRGTVIEDSSDFPVSMVDIRLVDGTGATIIRTLSDTLGQFRIEVPDTGTFSLAVRRVGYAPISADSIRVEAEDELEFVIKLNPRAVALEAVTVVARRRAEPLRLMQFRERAELNQRTGLGRIYTREDLDRIRPNSPQQILDGIVWGARCSPRVLLDGLPVEGQVPGLNYDELEGIEIYRGVTQIPLEFYRNGMCGLVMVWTRIDPPGMKPFSWARAAVAAGLVVVIGILMR